MRVKIVIVGLSLISAAPLLAQCPSRVIGGYGATLDIKNIDGLVFTKLKLGKGGALATPLAITACGSTTYKVIYEGSSAFVDRPMAQVDNQILNLKDACGTRGPFIAEGQGSAAQSSAIPNCSRK